MSEAEATTAETAPPGDVLVTGVGLVTPLGTGAEAVWEAWCRGESGIRTLAEDDPRLARGVDPSPLPAIGRAGFVRGFDPREHVERGLLRRMDWVSRMLVAAARQAQREAGWTGDEAPLERAAIVVGSQFGNQRETARYTRRVLDEGLGAGSPLLFPNLVLNAPAGYAAIDLGFTGPNLSVSEHEASGEAAVAAAMDFLGAGTCEVAIAGGVDEFGEVYLKALAERRLLHPDSCRTGRTAPQGWVVPGEGAAALFLEHADAARRRGARPYAVLETARTLGSRAPLYDLPSPAEAARQAAQCAEACGPVDAFIGLADGGPRRAAIDRACLDALAERQRGAVAYATYRDLAGDFGSIGALGIALAALSLRHGVLPTRDGARPRVRRIALVGAGRSGVLAPICLRAADG